MARMQAGLELRTTTQQYTWMRWKEGTQQNPREPLLWIQLSWAGFESDLL